MGAWLPRCGGVATSLWGRGCLIVWAGLPHCVGGAASLWGCGYLVGAWLPHCVGVATSLCGRGYLIVWVWLPHCVGVATSSCGRGYLIVWTWLPHRVGVATSLCGCTVVQDLIFVTLFSTFCVNLYSWNYALANIATYTCMWSCTVMVIHETVCKMSNLVPNCHSKMFAS